MMNLEKIQAITSNKDICLLGHAKTIMNNKKDIDSYDIVCRLNRAFPPTFFKSNGIERCKSSPYIGNRTDILFIGSEQNVSRCEPKVIIGYHGLTSGLWINSDKVIKRLPHFYCFSWADWADLRTKLCMTGEIGSSTGLMAINFLVKYCSFKSLTLFGFNFFETEAWYGTSHPSPTYSHKFNKEKEIVLDLIKNDKRIRLFKE